MNKSLEFTDFIELICTKPGLYVQNATYSSVVSFISGYAHGKDCPISGIDFHRFVCLKNSFPTNYVWEFVIERCSQSDEEALTSLKDTILEYCELKNRMNLEDIMQYAIEQATHSEGEAEKVFREFDKALLNGDKGAIQKLIINNEKAELLWAGKFPSSVEVLLTDIHDNQPIKRIYESEDGKTIKVIASGWPFPFTLVLKADGWKVNVDELIRFRERNNKS